MSMSLYNELRPPLSSDEKVGCVIKSYNWGFWYDRMRYGAKIIHENNPDVLVFLSGLDGDVDLGPVVDGTPLEPSAVIFNKSDFSPGFEDKLVLELHSYDIVRPVRDCGSYSEQLFEAGFTAMAPDQHPGLSNLENTTSTTTQPTTKPENRFPVMMTEWGFVQDNTTWRYGTYAQCVQKFLRNKVPGAGWFIWSLGGSHYVREGTQDYDEMWGLLNHDWSD